MDENRPILLNIQQFIDELRDDSLTCVDLLDRTAELGFDGIELRRESWDGYEKELPQVKRRADELDTVVTYATFTELLGKERGNGQEMLFRDIDIAAELGSPLLRVFLGRTPGDDDEIWETAREAVEYAEQKGIALTLENRGEMPGATLEEIVQTVETIDHPNLRINVDIGNYYSNGIDVVTAIQRLSDEILYTHLVDPTAPNGALGAGEMPVDEIVDALDALPQTVYYCFEFDGGDDPEEAIRESADFLRSRTN